MLTNLPVEQLISVLHAMPAQRAATVLLSMTPDRITTLVAFLDDPAIGDMLVAAEPSQRVALLAQLDARRIANILTGLSQRNAAAVLTSLPSGRVAAIMEDISPTESSALLDRLPLMIRMDVYDVMSADRAREVRRAAYCLHAVHALERTAAVLTPLPDEDCGGRNLRAGVLGLVFGIGVRYIADGTLRLSDLVAAEAAVTRLPVHGVLIVTNAVPDAEVGRYEALAGTQGRHLRTVTWREDQGDGVLGRALVGLST
jgi:hypothetical protein